MDVYRGFTLEERDGEWYAYDLNDNCIMQAATQEKLMNAIDDYKRSQRAGRTL